MPHLCLLWRLEAQAAPWGAPRLSSISQGWAACLLGRAAYSLRLLGPAWLGELCKEGRLCQCVTGQLPTGRHLGSTELESWGWPMAASATLPAGLTSWSTPQEHSAQDGVRASGDRTAQGNLSFLSSQGAQPAITGILITDICSALSMAGLYAKCFTYIVSLNSLLTHPQVHTYVLLSPFYR